jgi:hypothetical protein
MALAAGSLREDQMNKSIPLLLIIHGIVLFGLSIAICTFTSDVSPAGRYTGLVGGILCIVWGLMGRFAGLQRKAPSVLTLAVVSYVVLGQSIIQAEPGSYLVALGFGVMLIASFALLAFILHSSPTSMAAQRQ